MRKFSQYEQINVKITAIQKNTMTLENANNVY